MFEDDDFGEGVGGEMEVANIMQVAEKLNKDGFRIGKAKEEEIQMQKGFDEGFNEGIIVGKACGKMYGTARAVIQSLGISEEAAASLLNLEKILFETLPESDHEPTYFLDAIENEITQISSILIDAFNEFKSSIVLVTIS